MPMKNGWATGQEHCKNDGMFCPYCGSKETTFPKPLRVELGNANEDHCKCLSCQRTWGNLYRIAGWFDDSGISDLHDDTQSDKIEEMETTIKNLHAALIEISNNTNEPTTQLICRTALEEGN